ncbi:carboxy terminal-processing peptidase [Pantoea sp. Aalb]|uniref:carboxy terminal-processing peptidase n=1 Tax=Pantoea sp. Aalb TaxID=2576762 RepID=UPI0013265220|nr:carboxy terminal-processing peptidase [Pantoea sp. Aalb]MXP67372.1 tail-specific protease [Pantoea sp. Aalb]
MKKKILILSTITAGLLLTASFSIFSTNEIIHYNQIPQLNIRPEYPTVTKRIASYFFYSHYRKFKIDNKFSKEIFYRYLNAIDYNHNLLLTSEIAKFNSINITEKLIKGKLDIFYNLYNLVQKRRFEFYRYALSVLNCPMIFNNNDFIEINRKTSPWPKNKKEIQALWDDEIKYNEFILKITGKKDEEIQKKLFKKYKFAIHHLIQGNSEDVFQLAMTAFAHSIDPHTNYLSPDNTNQFNSHINLSLDGIGLLLHIDDNDHILIESIVPNGPAAKSKQFHIGDRIVGIGKTSNSIESIIGWRLDNVISKIRGPYGSKISIKILPVNKEMKISIITLIRQKIYLQDNAVKSNIYYIGKKKIALLRISSFYYGLTNDVKLQLQKLQRQNIINIVIDLRANGGGLLKEAISLSGLFIPNRPIVLIRNKNGLVHEENSNNSITYYKGPMIILVDHFSASASEIFAAAMQDYGRALIVGERTFGKGTVQKYQLLNRFYDRIFHYKWPTLGSVQYTTQKFYRINGSSTQCKGVRPDILMLDDLDVIENIEKYKENSLPWDRISAIKYTKIGNISPLIPKLTKLHIARIKKDPNYQYLIRYMKHIVDNIKNKPHIIFLNLEKYKKNSLNNDIKYLKSINKYYCIEWKTSLKNLSLVLKDHKKRDFYINETLKIANDMSKLETKQNKINLIF